MLGDFRFSLNIVIMMNKMLNFSFSQAISRKRQTNTNFICYTQHSFKFFLLLIFGTIFGKQ